MIGVLLAEPQGAQAITWEEGIHVYGTVTWQAGKHNKAFMKPPKFDHGGWPTPTNQSDPYVQRYQTIACAL